MSHHSARRSEIFCRLRHGQRQRKSRKDGKSLRINGANEIAHGRERQWVAAGGSREADQKEIIRQNDPAARI